MSVKPRELEPDDVFTIADLQLCNAGMLPHAPQPSRNPAPQQRVPVLPRGPDGTRKEEALPESDQGPAVKPLTEFAFSNRLAQDRFVHPGEDGRIVEVHAAVRLPEQPVR